MILRYILYWDLEKTAKYRHIAVKQRNEQQHLYNCRGLCIERSYWTVECKYFARSSAFRIFHSQIRFQQSV